MKALLLDDANRLSASLSEYEATRWKIDAAVYQTFTLITAYEKPAHSSKIRFYLEDGNHRVLVYAIFLRLHAVVYQPIRVIFSRDWSHLYPWAQLTS